jgi:hypothetical protein
MPSAAESPFGYVGAPRLPDQIVAANPHDGQQYGEALDYAPLPKPLTDRVDAKNRLIAGN